MCALRRAQSGERRAGAQAWAVEAQANVHKKMRNFRVAQECLDEAINIRTALQEKGDGKALFTKELTKDESVKSEIVQQRVAKRVARRNLMMNHIGEIVPQLQAFN